MYIKTKFATFFMLAYNACVATLVLMCICTFYNVFEKEVSTWTQFIHSNLTFSKSSASPFDLLRGFSSVYNQGPVSFFH